ncbi:MAG: VanZ family protein [Tannerella sp.]|jgi:VanZ family protein|nr:VanZ family protein [Tannerella sp.]
MSYGKRKKVTKRGKTKPGNRFLRALFTLLLLACIVFIFANSSEIESVSSSKSQLVTQWLNRLMKQWGIGFVFTEFLVRKLAHFSEYTLLGFWLILTLRIYTKRMMAHIAWPLFLGLLTAVSDELYQMFVPGRGSRILDVAIDFGGVVCGLLCGYIALLLVRKIFRFKKSGNQ